MSPLNQGGTRILRWGGGGGGEPVYDLAKTLEGERQTFFFIEIYRFFKKNLEDIGPFCGATDTSVLDIR